MTFSSRPSQYTFAPLPVQRLPLSLSVAPSRTTYELLLVTEGRARAMVANAAKKQKNNMLAERFRHVLRENTKEENKRRKS